MKSFKFFTKNNDFTELDKMVIEVAIYLNDTGQTIIDRDMFLDIGYTIRIESCGYANGVDEVYFVYHYRDESVVMLTQRRQFTIRTTEYIRIINEYRQNATI